MKKLLLILVLNILPFGRAWLGYAQELDATVKVNHSQIQGTDDGVFTSLEEKMTQLFNEHKWTNLQFQKNELIKCNFNITVTKYDQSQELFECDAVIQATRPVYNSTYSTILYNNTDKNFNFKFSQFDQIEFKEESVDNQLTALMAYYAYLIIGLDLDSFGAMAGDDILKQCLNLVNNAQNLEFPGWKPFEDDRNRYAFVNDYMEASLQPMRQLQYDYFHNGLDQMAENAERGRTNVTTALENDLKKAYDNNPHSLLPQIWTDYKKDELASIYNGKGTSKEKESIYDLMMRINPSQSNTWDKIKK